MAQSSTFSAITFDCYGTLIDWDTGAGVGGPPVIQSKT